MSNQYGNRQDLERRVSMGRSFILIYAVLTLVNIVMVICGVLVKFISAISAPYYLVFIGKGMDNGFAEGTWPVTSGLTLGCAAFAVLLVAVFYGCWALSKKHMGWVVVALIFFIVDTALLVAVVVFLYRGNLMFEVMDLLFHLWIIYLLIRCIAAHKELCWIRDMELLEQSDSN